MTTPLTRLLHGEIEQRGAIPFARFMELALYHPAHGYYERDSATVGKRGDFYTSVSVGPLFGELLATQFAAWAADDDAFQIVEAGAHDGRLAADILGWLQQWRPELFARLEYWIIEPSPRRQAWQRETLREYAPQLHWVTEFPPRHAAPPFHGVLFANELLDAFPVQRLGWDAPARAWFEWGVAGAGERFEWVRLPFQILAFPFQIPAELLAVLPDGFTLEICPAAEAWWTAAARALRHGHLLTFDYGLTTEEFLSPTRAAGTVSAYQQQHLSADLLAQPGEQDLTAHVNFTTLQAAGERVGLRTAELCTQARFLTPIAEATWQAPAEFPPWDAGRVRQFQTLTHPEHLGRAFRVLVQAR